MKWFVNILALLITFSVFKVATTDFEIAVLAILVLIYSSISTFSLLQSRINLEMIAGETARYIELKKAMKKYNYEENIVLEELNKKIKKSHDDWLISTIALSIMYFIAIWNLLGAIL